MEYSVKERLNKVLGHSHEKEWIRE